MIVFVLCILILIYAIYLHDKGEKAKSGFIFFIFLTDGFLLLHPEWIENSPISKYSDFALLFLGYIWIQRLWSKRDISHLSRAPIFKWFLILIAYLTFEFILTIVLQKEMLGFAVKTYRRYLFFLSYVIFIEMSPSQIKRLLVNVSLATFFTSIIYVTQPIHNLPILSDFVGLETMRIQDNGMARFRNIPKLLYFLLIYATIKIDASKLKSLLVLGVMGLSLILTQHRGVMIGYVITIFLYILMNRKLGKLVQYTLIGLIALLLVGDLVFARFENKGQISTSDDIQTVLHTDYAMAAANGYDDQGGTLAFRVLLFVERFDYFRNNPQYMLTGVGMRHEDSPKTYKEFDFILGSRKIDKETGVWIPQQIDSGDLVWFTPFVKFGFVGLVLYIYITIVMLQFFYHHRKNGLIPKTAFYYYVLLIVISMKNDMLFALIQISFLLMLVVLILKINKLNNIGFKKHLNFRLLGRNWM